MKPIVSVLTAAGMAASTLPSALAQHVFTGEGNWLEVERWDQGVLPPDGSTAIIAGTAEITENIVPTQNANPSRVIIGDFDDGSLTVSGGTLSGAHGGANSGVFVGANGGSGTLIIEQGATFRSQGAAMVLRIGDDFDGTGFVSVAGEFQNYKFLELINGTLEMQPTGINNKFNSNDQSFIGPAGNLAYVIDGPAVGTISRSNAAGLNIDIDPASNLLITLGGNFALNDSWTLMTYTTLFGEFSQGTAFTNSQGYTFAVDYGSGFDDSITLTLTGDDLRPKVTSFAADPAAVSAGQPTTLSWDASNFDSLTLSPGDVDVTALAQTQVSPTETTTYTLTASLGDVTVTTSTTVVVDELPEINSFTTDRLVIAPGEQALLSWDVSGADSIDIPPLTAPFAGYDLVGSRDVSPAETTTYTLNATNATGTVSQQVEVVVDAIEASLIHRYDPAAPGQSSGALLDGVGTKNFDMTGGNLVTGVTSDNTSITAAMDRANQEAITGGDNGDGFPSAATTFELWLLSSTLDLRPQVIFETGAPGDGTSLIISQTSIRLLHSTLGLTTIDLEIPTSAVNIANDFFQVIATLDPVAGRANLYARGSAGGSTSGFAEGDIGNPNARASLFTWSGFGGGAAAALGGTADGPPADVTSFKGLIGLFNIYGRALTTEETEETFTRVSSTPIGEGDTDADNLPDFWELTFFGNLDQTATGNTDGDTLTHLEELAAGTDPTLADSDADGLDDNVEIEAGFPTNPLDPDSDDDFLTDGEEVNGNPPTDPNAIDTDLDFFWDVFEVDRGSDPDNFNSVPPADDIGSPFAAIHQPGTYQSFENLFAVDAFDASFRVAVDFSEKNDASRELVFETGGGTTGTSLTYETGSELVLRAAGDGGFTIATVRHPLTPEQLAAGELDIVFTYDTDDGNLDSVISLFIDGSLVGSDTQFLGGDWSGTNAATFGAASPDLAGGGNNTPLNAVAPTSLAINHRRGLTLYSEVLYDGGTPTAPAGPRITAFEFDPILGTVDITWTSEPGTSYRIAGSNSLTGWTDELADSVTATATTTSSSVPLPPTAAENYNVRVEVIQP